MLGGFGCRRSSNLEVPEERKLQFFHASSVIPQRPMERSQPTPRTPAPVKFESPGVGAISEVVGYF